MNKRFWKLIIPVLILLVIWGIRFVYVNVSTEKVVTEIYNVGDEVAFGEDYFIRSAENSNGYTITVKQAELKRYEDFAAEMKIELPEIPEEQQDDVTLFRADYVYDVEVIISNQYGEDNGIDLFNVLLVTPNARLCIDRFLWKCLYPQLDGSLSFALRTGTDMTFHFPYAVETAFEQQVLNKQYLESHDFYLNISQYPVKKQIKVNG